MNVDKKVGWLVVWGIMAQGPIGDMLRSENIRAIKNILNSNLIACDTLIGVIIKTNYSRMKKVWIREIISNILLYSFHKILNSGST